MRRILLDRLGLTAAHLERIDFLCLGYEQAELLAPISRVQFQNFSQILGCGKALDQIKAGISIALCDVDDFAV